MANRTRLGALERAVAAAVLGFALGAGAVSGASAQDTLESLNNYRLPPGPNSTPSPLPTATPSPRPTAAVPIAPVPTVSASPRPTATPSPSPTVRATPSATPTAAAPTASPRATPSPTAAATADAPPPAAPRDAASPSPAPAPLPARDAVSSPDAIGDPAPGLAAASGSGLDWRLLAALALAVLGAAAWLLRDRLGFGMGRSAQAAAPEPRATPAVSPATASPPAALPSRPRQPQPRAAPQPPSPRPAAPPPAAKRPQPPPPAAPRRDQPLNVALHARRLSATLLNTALNYELVVTNLGERPVGPVAVTCDMIGAHASLPERFQLENPGEGEPVHRIPHLGPGESATMSGELRLPLNAITPIRRGEAALFVPLARFRILVWRENRPPVAINRTFVIGETPPSPDAALKPFRLDLGPRMYSSISQREVAVTA